MAKPYIPENLLNEMWLFMLERSVPELLEEKIKERESKGEANEILQKA